MKTALQIPVVVFLLLIRSLRSMHLALLQRNRARIQRKAHSSFAVFVKREMNEKPTV